MLRNFFAGVFLSLGLISAYSEPVLLDITDPAARQEIIRTARNSEAPVELRVKAIEALAQAARFSDTTPHLKTLTRSQEPPEVRAAAVTSLADAAAAQDVRYMLRVLTEAQEEALPLRMAAAKSLSVYLIPDEYAQFLLFKIGRDKSQAQEIRIAALHAAQAALMVGRNADLFEYVLVDKEDAPEVRAQAARSLAARLPKDSELLGVYLKAAPRNDLAMPLRLAILEALSTALNSGGTQEALVRVTRDSEAPLAARQAALRSLEGPPECILPSPDPRWWMRPPCR